MIRLFLGLILSSFIVNFIAIVPFINLLYQLRFTRKKEAVKTGKKSDFDKMHDWKAGTPTGGGNLIILLTIILYTIIALVLPKDWIKNSIYPFMEEVHILLLTFISFGILGFLDDWRKFFGKPEKGEVGQKFGITGKLKFFIQWGLGFLISTLIFFNLKVDFIHLPFTQVVVNLGWFFVPFAAFVIVMMSNAYNITDGLDGLSTGLALIALTAFAIISFSSLDLPLSLFLGLWIGALIAYLYFNIYPARLSLGDAGALSFGATLAVIGLLTGKIFALFFICGIFLLEMFSSFIQLASIRLRGKKIFPMAPIHLTFQLLGWHEAKIVQRAWLAAALLAIFGLWLAF
jgi:phospho-N-acetylmuramoyl-pentapeptide-transferase